jgi:hypothetical protein
LFSVSQLFSFCSVVFFSLIYLSFSDFSVSSSSFLLNSQFSSS